MSKSVEDTRRELFEAQLISAHPGAVMIVGRKTSGSYRNGYVQSRWDGFNAALDAVEIELPKGESNMTTGALHMISRCHQSIESLNLGLKIK